MAAYLLKIGPVPKCRTCGAKATVIVKNTYNATVGEYCTKHGEKKVEELNRES